jgi:hypothetical protein
LSLRLVFRSFPVSAALRVPSQPRSAAAPPVLRQCSSGRFLTCPLPVWASGPGAWPFGLPSCLGRSGARPESLLGNCSCVALPPASLQSCLAGLSRHPAARLAGTRSALGCVQLDRKPIPVEGSAAKIPAQGQDEERIIACRTSPVGIAPPCDALPGRRYRAGSPAPAPPRRCRT